MVVKCARLGQESNGFAERQAQPLYAKKELQT